MKKPQLAEKTKRGAHKTAADSTALLTLMRHKVVGRNELGRFLKSGFIVKSSKHSKICLLYGESVETALFEGFCVGAKVREFAGKQNALLRG